MGDLSPEAWTRYVRQAKPILAVLGMLVLLIGGLLVGAHLLGTKVSWERPPHQPRRQVRQRGWAAWTSLMCTDVRSRTIGIAATVEEHEAWLSLPLPARRCLLAHIREQIGDAHRVHVRACCATLPYCAAAPAAEPPSVKADFSKERSNRAWRWRSGSPRSPKPGGLV
jgi:hypothetical protein